jgi:hypothetical protein
MRYRQAAESTRRRPGFLAARSNTLRGMNPFLRPGALRAALTGLLSSLWLVSLVLVLLTVATPLEFVPLSLGNIPRWILWGLAFPACRHLWLRTGRFRWVWNSLPWVLWLLLLVAEGLAVGVWCRVGTQTAFWQNVRYPLEKVFANRERWRTARTLFRRGPLVLVHQLCWEPRYGIVDLRQARIVPLVPGLQWVSCLPGDFQPGVVDTSWQLVDTVAAEMSQDTALQRRVKPWLLKRDRVINGLKDDRRHHVKGKE